MKTENNLKKNWEDYKYLLNKIIEIFDLKLLILILGILCILISPIIKIPNFIGISSYQASITLTIIIGALSSILGVLIAIIIVAFNILRKSYNTYAFKTFFENPKLSEFITIYLMTITISYFTLITISDPLKFQSINLIYLSTILFIFSIWSIFPYSRAIIISTQSEENIEKIVSSIERSDINAFDIRTNLIDSYSISRIEDNPIFILSELGTRTLNEDDRLTSIRILVKTKEKLISMLDYCIKNKDKIQSGTFDKDGKRLDQDERILINGFLIIVKSIALKSVQIKNEFVLQNVFGFIEDIHVFCAKNKLS